MVPFHQRVTKASRPHSVPAKPVYVVISYSVYKHKIVYKSTKVKYN